ncbi:MAG TPA: SPOR domain-containing protein [Gammaproteobacteria bacterium]|nr:SPOR domain-containing protein [Gammaproteobacteria bacterium]
MMRLFIMLLLLANIVYFTVEFIFGNAAYTPPAAIKPGIPAIELIKNKESTSKTASALSTRCYTVGPYNSEKAMQLVATQLNDFGLAVKIRREKTKDTLNYLVYLVAQETREASLKIIEDIKKNDVKDYHLIKSGPYKNAISFGFFNDLNKARRHSEYIRFLGYDARYTEQKAVREIFWLDYDEQPDKSAPVLKWSKAIDPSSIVQKIPRWCEF